MGEHQFHCVIIDNGPLLGEKKKEYERMLEFKVNKATYISGDYWFASCMVKIELFYF